MGNMILENIKNTVRHVYKIWMSLAAVIGWLMTRLILLVLFYLIVTPIGIFVKLFDKDPLNIKFNKNIKSYWITKRNLGYNGDSYEKQF